MCATVLGVIHGIPCVAPELNELITRIDEKDTEDSIRSIWNQGVKETRTLETNDDFDDEQKSFNDKIKSLDINHVRLEHICHNVLEIAGIKRIVLGGLLL